MTASGNANSVTPSPVSGCTCYVIDFVSGEATADGVPYTVTQDGSGAKFAVGYSSQGCVLTYTLSSNSNSNSKSAARSKSAEPVLAMSAALSVVALLS